MRRAWLLTIVTLPVFCADGEALFAKHCSIGYCHGAGGAAARGPRLRDRDFDAAYVYRVTRDGVVRSAMPAWKDRLPDAEIRDIVAYVMKLSGRPADLAPAEGSASLSPAAFLEACGSCHKAGGHGNTIGPPLSTLTETQLRDGLKRDAAKTVRLLKTKDGDAFPAVIVSESDGLVQVYDVAETPPVKRTLERSEIESSPPAARWTHPESIRLTKDIVDFLQSESAHSR